MKKNDRLLKSLQLEMFYSWAFFTGILCIFPMIYALTQGESNKIFAFPMLKVLLAVSAPTLTGIGSIWYVSNRDVDKVVEQGQVAVTRVISWIYFLVTISAVIGILFLHVGLDVKKNIPEILVDGLSSITLLQVAALGNAGWLSGNAKLASMPPTQGAPPNS